MMFRKIVTIDDELWFENCEVRKVDKSTKKLFCDKDLIEIIEKGKIYVVNTDYITMILR